MALGKFILFVHYIVLLKISFLLQLPLLDDSVDVMISLDSDITDRELAAVHEWMSSDEHTFHVMRDHPYHCIEMLRGSVIYL